MSEFQNNCLYCRRSSMETPLLAIEYQGKQYWICPRDLPIMIHKPHLLVDVLPGFAQASEADHEH